MATASPGEGGYEGYKEQSEAIVQWLYRTATDLQRSSTKNASNSGKVSISELKHYARLIGRRHPRCFVPDWVIKLIVVVIDLREAAAAFHKARRTVATPKDTLLDVGHRYFIVSLRTILQELRMANLDPPRGPSRRQRQKQEVPAASIAGKYRNSFVSLSVEEPNEAFCIAAPNRSHRNPPKAKVILDANGDEERELRLFFILSDFQNMRDTVSTAWNRYHSGEISMQVAAETSEIAFGMMRRASEKLAKQFPELDTYDRILQHMGLELDSNRYEPAVIVRESREIIDPLSTTARAVCPEAASTLRHLASSWFPSAAIGAKDAAPKAVPPGQPKFEREVLQQSDELFSYLTQEGLGSNEFRKCFQPLANSGQARIDTVSIFQVHMDIYTLLSADLDFGVSSVIARARRVMTIA